MSKRKLSEAMQLDDLDESATRIIETTRAKWCPPQLPFLIVESR